jgi:hypothetical protein
LPSLNMVPTGCFSQTLTQSLFGAPVAEAGAAFFAAGGC